MPSRFTPSIYRRPRFSSSAPAGWYISRLARSRTRQRSRRGLHLVRLEIAPERFGIRAETKGNRMARTKEAIPFDLKCLQRDLNDAAPKWASFSALAKSRGVNVGYDIFRRAKNEGFATEESLAKIARVLGFKAERYVEAGHPRPERQFDLPGRWVAIYLARPQNAVVRTWEALRVEQSSERLHDEYDFLKTEKPNCPRCESIYKMRARIVRDLVVGNFWAGGRSSPDGIGSFQLKIRPSGMIAEGCCSFYGDDGLIAVSHNVWTRADGSHEAAYQFDAAERRILAQAIYHELPLLG